MVPSQFLMRRGCGPVGDNISYLHGLWGERFQAQLFSCSLQERTLQSGIIIREMSWFQRLKIVILVSFNRSFCLKKAWTLRPLSSARSGTRKASKGSWSSPQTSSCSLTFEVKILIPTLGKFRGGQSKQIWGGQLKKITLYIADLGTLNRAFLDHEIDAI